MTADLYLRRYTFKLYPTASQIAVLERHLVLHARLWNAALQERMDCYRLTGKTLSAFDQGKHIKTIRADDAEYMGIHSDSLYRTLDFLDKAMKAFFARAKKGAGASSGFPKFKRSVDHDTLPFREKFKGWKFLPQGGANWKLRVFGLDGFIKARGKFPLNPVEFRTMEIQRKIDGWFMSVVVKLPARLTKGVAPTDIKFDLIDQFAVVKTATGGCSPDVLCDAENVNSSSTRDSYVVPPLRECRNCGRTANVQKLVITGTSRGQVAGEQQEERCDILKSQRDKTKKRGSIRWKRETRRIAKASAKQARQRKAELHIWTTNVVRGASTLTVSHPPIKETTRSGAGNEKAWGAAVKTVAAVNRHILNQAPASAIQMLTYKAEEAGIDYIITVQTAPKAAIGHEISQSVRKVRTAKRQVLKEIRQ